TWTHRADEGLAPGGTYDYQVRQCKGGSCSGWSKALRVAYTYAAPAAPTNLQQRCTSRYIAAIDEYVTECSLSWADNAGNEERYELLSQQAGASTWQTLALPANTTSHKPAAGAAARYYVRACNAAGCSAPSNTITWTDP
ncbi:MAG TPA: fibronectin type III domain-containing protein, partial [Vicinamibacteria bacterium]|nr:fibronectin type III domain-containing protein [Vicinamibacteria bacterium]